MSCAILLILMNSDENKACNFYYITTKNNYIKIRQATVAVIYLTDKHSSTNLWINLILKTL